MGRVVIGGLLTPTLRTLFAVPVMYTFFDDFSARLARKWGGEFPTALPRPTPRTLPRRQAIDRFDVHVHTPRTHACLTASQLVVLGGARTIARSGARRHV